MYKYHAKLLLFLIFISFFPTATNGQTSLAESLMQDSTLQEATIIAIRNALGGRDRTAVVRRGGFLIDIQIYIETYRGMHDANTLANIQNRYSAAKAELLEPRLPATIEELVSILEILQ
ncbi:MAG: hypothetical protein COA96_10555 [SAR86 cluster bacterium]|uniref:Uncharacterized protein n=1 Tax=SAR86 cluster bacterium TaxID=2030880 RepID=A0A2A5AXR7_9GAMM|nr:MAG: hypothetical protein COA96_10555 [SAR86 cluster bacterium]